MSLYPSNRQYKSIQPTTIQTNIYVKVCTNTCIKVSVLLVDEQLRFSASLDRLHVLHQVLHLPSQRHHDSNLLPVVWSCCCIAHFVDFHRKACDYPHGRYVFYRIHGCDFYLQSHLKVINKQSRCSRLGLRSLEDDYEIKTL